MTQLNVDIRITDSRLYAWGELRRASDGAAGYDLHAMGIYPLGDDKKPIISARRPLVREVIELTEEPIFFDVGLSIHIRSPNHAGIILPRSSSAPGGYRLGNTIGLIDSDYTGPLIVSLQRTAFTPTVSLGDRIAQIIFERVDHPVFKEVDAFVETARGSGGHGSTGR